MRAGRCGAVALALALALEASALHAPSTPTATLPTPLDVHSAEVGARVWRQLREARRDAAARRRRLGARAGRTERDVSAVALGHAVRLAYGVLPHAHPQEPARPAGRLRAAWWWLQRRGRRLAAAGDDDAGGGADEGDEVLTEANTRPIRIKPMFDALYEDTAAPHSVCFRTGDWVRVGWPRARDAPPADGSERCDRAHIADGGLSSDCWLECEPSDVLTEPMRAYAINATLHALADARAFLRVRARDGSRPLSLRRSVGTYIGFYTAVGEGDARCAADCSKLHALRVRDQLCDDPAGAGDVDVLLYVRHPPPVDGVAGTGSSCALDERTRPVVVVFDWHALGREPAAWGAASEAEVRQTRALVLHELFHGLGYAIEHWTNVFAPDGTRRRVVADLRVPRARGGAGASAAPPSSSSSGAEDDGLESVWHFLPGTRTFDVAAAYFGCDDPAGPGGWSGFPLMSYPDFGRASHAETRLLREDVMSYGEAPFAVSALTLAALEDLGHYLANYSAAECISWGLNQGCDFVSRRCEARAHRAAVQLAQNASAAELCARAWPTLDSVVADTTMCAPTACAEPPAASHDDGAAPPSGVGGAPGSTGGGHCDAECLIDGAVSSVVGLAAGVDAEVLECGRKPEGSVRAAGVPALPERVDAGWRSWLVLLLLMVPPAVGLLCALDRARALGARLADSLCPRTPRDARAALVVRAFALLGVAVGGTLAGFGVYGLAFYSTAEEFLSKNALLALALSGAGCAGLNVGALRAAARLQPCGLGAYGGLSLLALLGQLALACVVLHWVHSLDTIENAALTTLASKEGAPTDGGGGGNGTVTRGRWFGVPGSASLRRVESFVCQTYQLCCSPRSNATAALRNGSAAADGGARRALPCMPVHAGAGAAGAIGVAALDPSADAFCEYISGHDGTIAAQPGVCALLDERVDGFSLRECREDFCDAGLDGYGRFVSTHLEFARAHGVALGGLLMGACLVQLALVVAAFVLRTAAVRARAHSPPRSARVGKRRGAAAAAAAAAVLPLGRRRRGGAVGAASEHARAPAKPARIKDSSGSLASAPAAAPSAADDAEAASGGARATLGLDALAPAALAALRLARAPRVARRPQAGGSEAAFASIAVLDVPAPARADGAGRAARARALSCSSTERRDSAAAGAAAPAETAGAAGRGAGSSEDGSAHARRPSFLWRARPPLAHSVAQQPTT